MNFRFQGLSPAPFQPLFALDEMSLAARGIRRMVVDEKLGFPCRVSLHDAEPGERVLLLNYEHQSSDTPYRARGPIFVCENAGEAFDGPDVPPVLRTRLLSLRAYDGDGMMVDADVIEGTNVEALLTRLFAREDADYVHVHYARRGCYACRVERG